MPELSQAALSVQGIAAELLEFGGTGSTSPEAPDTSRHLPLVSQKEIFFHPMLLFLPLKEHVGKL